MSLKVRGESLLFFRCRFLVRGQVVVALQKEEKKEIFNNKPSFTFQEISRCVDSRPRVDVDCHCRCAVVVCCRLANRLALTVSENERIIANYITDFHKLYNHLWKTRRKKCGTSTLPPVTNKIEQTEYNELTVTNEDSHVSTQVRSACRQTLSHEPQDKLVHC